MRSLSSIEKFVIEKFADEWSLKKIIELRFQLTVVVERNSSQAVGERFPISPSAPKRNNLKSPYLGSMASVINFRLSSGLINLETAWVGGRNRVEEEARHVTKSDSLSRTAH